MESAIWVVCYDITSFSISHRCLMGFIRILLMLDTLPGSQRTGEDAGVGGQELEQHRGQPVAETGGRVWVQPWWEYGELLSKYFNFVEISPEILHFAVTMLRAHFSELFKIVSILMITGWEHQGVSMKKISQIFYRKSVTVGGGPNILDRREAWLITIVLISIIVLILMFMSL